MVEVHYRTLDDLGDERVRLEKFDDVIRFKITDKFLIIFPKTGEIHHFNLDYVERFVVVSKYKEE